MRHRNSMFETGNDRGTGDPGLSKVQILTIVLSVISVIAAILIIANFGMITAQIAMNIANLLSSGALVLVTIVALAVLIGRFRWRARRSFWGW